MAGYIGSKASVTQVDGYNRTDADAEFVNDPNSVITVSGSNVGINTSSPSSYASTTLEISGSSTTSDLKMTNTTTGTGNASGFDLELNGSDINYVNRTASGNQKFWTNSTERLRIDSSGNVGIGVVPETWSNLKALQINSQASISADASSIQLSSNAYYNSGWKHINSSVATNYYQDSGTHVWRNAVSGSADAAISWSEAMRIDSSGNLLVGTTSNLGSSRMFVQVAGSGGNGITTRPDVDATYTPMVFRRGNGTAVGTITSTTTATSYNTSSDYRLKTDAQPMTGASARVQALKPVNFEWLSDGTRVDGFLAHEAQAVVPEAVTGTKDAMRDEEYEVTPAVLDDDGNVVTEAVMGTRSVPDYQGIDQSKLVPLLTAALQEALTKIDTMETRLAALEAV